MSSDPKTYETKEAGTAHAESPVNSQFDEAFPREGIEALPSWCTALASSGCNRCVAVCPQHAITLGGQGPSINKDACSLCGLCAGVCDAFAWERSTLKDLVQRAIREAAEEGFVCFTCNDHLFFDLSPRGNVIVVPCLGALPPEFWSVLLAQGIKLEIYRDASYCETCSVAGKLGSALFIHALDLAEEWTGRHARFCQKIPERESLLAFAANIEADDRRGLLRQFAHEGLDIASGKHRRRNASTVQDFQERQERMRAQGRIKAAWVATFQEKRSRPRQELALQAASALPEQAGKWVRHCSTTDRSKCCSHKACIKACQTGARQMGEQGYPCVDAKLCIACGVCISVCPEGACDFIQITAQEYLT